MNPTDPEKRLEELARKWLEGTITPEEEQEFAQWYNLRQDDPVDVPRVLSWDEETHKQRILTTISGRIRQAAHRRRPRWQAAVAAAVLLALVSAGAYNILSHRDHRPSPLADASEPSPGSDKATLTLENGAVISLDEINDGLIKEREDLRIVKKQGIISYEPSGTSEAPATYHTLSVPRGGQYKVNLSDGSTVWLNSESTLSFPARFGPDERYVRLSGEAFFEIAQVGGNSGEEEAKIPFLVNVNNKQTVRVLGTKFNINSYADEEYIKTTLLEGSVEVAVSPGRKSLLKPREQAKLSHDGAISVTNRVNMEEVFAWKNGQLIFRETDIKQIMRQISRWYDVTVVYEGNIPARRFTGEISRDSKLSNLLQILETSGIRFEAEGRTIVVKP